MRTPAAVLVARLDELPPGPEFDTFRDDVRALSRTVTQFLSSSGADRLEIPDGARTDLCALAERVVGALFPIAEARGERSSCPATGHRSMCMAPPTPSRWP